MNNMKKLAAILAVMAVSVTAFTACGGEAPETEAPATEAATEAETETEPETEAETEPETEAETEDEFTLLDLDASMIDLGLYAQDDNGVEYVLTMFQHGGAPYCSLILVDQDGNNDLMCGEYTAETVTDENGIDYTKMSFTDAYTGENYSIGCAEPDDGSCYIYNNNDEVFEAKYLTADETMDYMAAAIAVAEGAADSDDADAASDEFSLLDVDASMVTTGLYATGDNGEEIVLSLFTYDDTDYVSLMMFDGEGNNDVICGAYTGEAETDENDILWSMMSFDDIYTGAACKVGCAEPDDGSCYIFDMNANIYEAKYLTPDETIDYMGAAVAVAAENE